MTMYFETGAEQFLLESLERCISVFLLLLNNSQNKISQGYDVLMLH